MSTIKLTGDFQRSITEFESWPSNSIHKNTNIYPTALGALRSRLDSLERDLCVKDETRWEVPIRDLQTAAGKKLHSCNAHNEEKLRDWLHVVTSVDSNDPKRQIVSARQRDPKCRFIYIHSDDSRSPLRINRKMLTLIMTYHQVMATYLDFMLVFGAQSKQRDLRFSGFREQTMISSPARGLRIPELGRSGRQFQLCYNLKSVAYKTEQNEWSVRQAAIHHQFDVEEGTALWIVTMGRTDLLDRFKELTGKDARPQDKSFATPEECFRSSLAVHLMYCYWSTENWRWYIQHLETAFGKSTDMAMYGVRAPGYGFQEYQPRDVQDLHLWTDQVNEAVMVLESNADVMESLRQYYSGLKDNADFPLRTTCSDDIRNFAAQVGDMVSDFKMQTTRARLLVRNVSDRKELILQHLQSQASERMETVSHHMAREAIVMRIITIVTLIYLPATFVSTFFSTDIIKYQNQDGPPSDGSFSSIAMTRWLEVTLPLTAITLVIAWTALKFAGRDSTTSDISTHLIQKIPEKTRTLKDYLLPKFLKKVNTNEKSLLPVHEKR